MSDLDAAQILLQKFSPQQLQEWARQELQKGGPPSLEEFIHDHLQEETWSLQREIIRSVEVNRFTAVKSCHGPGKSFIASRIAASWIGRYKAGSAFVVTSAPSEPQVKAILWREINKAFKAKKKMFPPGSRVNQKEWWIEGELVAFGRKPQDQDPAAFQGIHQDYLLVIFDEASGMPDDLWNAAVALMTNDNCRFLAIGNPDIPETRFEKICQPGSGWKVIHIPAWATPNFTGEKVSPELANRLVSKQWVKDAEQEYGKDSPLYRSKVDAEFPVDSEDGVVPASKALRCRVAKELSASDLLPVTLGVDVGAGGDATVIRERRGRKAGRVWRNRSRDSETVTNLIVHAILETGASKVRIDSAGIGWGVVGHVRAKLRELKIECRVLKVNVSQKSTKEKRFPKLRDQLWWEVGRDNSVNGYWDLSECDDRTMADLLAVKYEIDAQGRVKIEKKEDTKERLKRSPDDADALLLAFYDGRGMGADFLDAWDKMLREQGREQEADELQDRDYSVKEEEKEAA